MPLLEPCRSGETGVLALLLLFPLRERGEGLWRVRAVLRCGGGSPEDEGR